MMKRNKPIKRSAPPKRKKQIKSTSSQSSTKKQQKPIRKTSKKQEDLYKLRRPFVEKILSENPYCQACPAFAKHDGKVVFSQNRSSDVHELVRRSQGGSIIDESNVIAVCRKCHTRIGNNPQLAFDLGLAKHGWER
jgi:5-methylcytosine-specific restriction endonuclease McrA